MIYVYLNYPQSKISVHQNPNCRRIRLRKKDEQRVIRIEQENLDSEIGRINRGELKFAPSSRYNDAWIVIELGDLSKEQEITIEIKEILGRFYGPFARASINIHCPKLSSRESIRSYYNSHLKQAQNGLNIISPGGIPDRQKKKEEILYTITNRIREINLRYRKGPDLYFYRRLVELRKKNHIVSDFISDNYNVEILYATLVSWDMNSRGAKLKYFDEFKRALVSCLPQLEAIERALQHFSLAESYKMMEILETAYTNLHLMETSGRLVSNSKCLHFLFPSLLMPIDKTNTLDYLYGNNYESVKRYLEIIEFSFEIMRSPIKFEGYLDDLWNQSVPKMIDNAIILLSGKSLKGSG